MQKENDIIVPLLMQFICLLAFELGIICALWQVGNSIVTLCAMGAAPLALAISRIPYRFYPDWLRFSLQIALAVAGLQWFAAKSGVVQVDIVLVECAAAFCIALLIGGRIGEHWILSVLALALGLYGGLHPGRDIYFPSFVALCIVLCILFYTSRNQALGAEYGARNKRNTLACLMHFALALAIAVIGMRKVVLRSIRTRGILPVSFQTGQEHEFPQLCGKWLAPAKKLLPGNEGDGADVNSRQSIKDASASNKAFMEAKGEFSARNGAGEGQGEELLFQAYTTAKLYWVAQIYDTYDGDMWTRSEMLKNGDSALDAYEPQDLVLVNQRIAIIRRQNCYLPYAYRPVKLEIGGMIASRASTERSIVRQKDSVAYLFMASNAGENLPVYSVESMVPAYDLKQRPRPWNEPPHNFGWNCRTVPPKVRTPQLLELAMKITQNAETPMEKADAIRDYLRKTYKYNAEAPDIPATEETVNYFLFKSKEGSCRHFAQAMVMLARMNGLYSRLATGYSPGNYNMLSNCFEIFQYHAHAWAQVFIEPYGWLTYDGVAPGNLRIGDNNRRLQNLFDPFGDTWKSKSPELSPDNFGSTKEQVTAQAETSQDAKTYLYENKDIMSQIEERARRDQQSPEAIAFAKAAVSIGLEKLGELWDKAVKMTEAFWYKLKEWLYWRIIRFYSLKAKWHYLIIGIGGLLVVCWMWSTTITQWLRGFTSRLKCAWLWHRAQSARNSNPSLCIECCQRHNGILLAMKYRRIPKGDVVERGLAIREAEPRSYYMTVAQFAQCVWYSARKITPDMAEASLAATGNLRNLMW
ncbi:MAG: transglutaminase domain-containing protein [Victivallales bacterium]|nr:transglutaminase domain-containing protein [Victivallales bacterium]